VAETFYLATSMSAAVSNSDSQFNARQVIIVFAALGELFISNKRAQNNASTKRVTDNERKQP